MLRKNVHPLVEEVKAIATTDSNTNKYLCRRSNSRPKPICSKCTCIGSPPPIISACFLLDATDVIAICEPSRRPWARA